MLLHDMPDDLFCYLITPDSSGSANTPKQLSVRNCTCIHPFINSVFDQSGTGKKQSYGDYPWNTPASKRRSA
jgi:hypothetical protein